MFFHIILTTECNLRCRYCYGEALEDLDTDFPGFKIDYSLPKKISYSLDLLDRFCRRDRDCVLIFYGGEPLLCIRDIKEIMDRVKAKDFIIQTNGLLLDALEPEYLNRLSVILVSIDGDEALTDYYRGRGTFRRVIENLKLVLRNGFKGEVIARMTVMEQTDIYKQVRWLIENEELPFSSVHWQLNAGFWADYARRSFADWGVRSYNPGIRKLVKLWVDYMEERSIVLRLYPFLGVVSTLLFGGDQGSLRCGGGWINYAVQTDGHIVPCPSMWGMKDYYLGHISSADPTRLKKVYVSKPCIECDIFPLCRGRCLYANITRRWSAYAYSQVCGTVRNLVEAISREVGRIKALIKAGRIRPEDFEFMRYNGCEIIP